MLGAIAGDIIGSIYEYRNIKTKDFKLFGKFSHPTDDSVLTAAICAALLECGDNFEHLSEITVKYMHRIGRAFPFCGYSRSFKAWLFEDNAAPCNKLSNGAAMRVSGCSHAARTLDEVKALSYAVTAVSHNHPEGIKGAEAVAVAGFLAKTGKSKDEIRRYIEQNYYRLDFTLDEIRPTYSFDVTCAGSVPQALAAFFESTDYEDAVRNAVSLGGDSDTLAAIAGGIAELYYGMPESVRNTAIERLDEPLPEIVEAFEKKYPPKIIGG